MTDQEIEQDVTAILDRCVLAPGTRIPVAYDEIRAVLSGLLRRDAMHFAQSEARGRALLAAQDELGDARQKIERLTSELQREKPNAEKGQEQGHDPSKHPDRDRRG